MRKGRYPASHAVGRLVASAVLVFLLASCAEDGATPDPAAIPAPSSSASGLSLVAIGDSIPFNDPGDCPDCTGFVDRYGDAVAAATGQTVSVRNLSQHTGLTLPELIDGLDRLHGPLLAAADVIVVGIAHNSSELASDTPCGAPLDENQMPDWSTVDAGCAASAAAKYRPQYEQLFSRVLALRNGQPTILRTINRYSDWIGWAEAGLTPEQERKTTVILDAWNEMLCSAAEKHGFACVDIYHAFNGPDGSKASGDLLAEDYTHPSDKGNGLIAELLEARGFAPLA